MHSYPHHQTLLPKFLGFGHPMKHYILNEDNEPVVCENSLEWVKWYHNTPRAVGLTKVGEDVRVSTVFLGMDHSFAWVTGLEGPPILWETMIFGGYHSDYQERYASHEDAVMGHKRAVIWAIHGLGKSKTQELDLEESNVDPV